MKKFFRKFLFFVLCLFLFNVSLSIVVLRNDLKRRYPGLDFSKRKTGVASWYSKTDKNINKHTANGEVFNDKKMTCASWDYPFNQKLVVINVTNGKWVTCRVNDRGPNKRLKRVIDLTKAAFKKISNTRPGLIYVMVIPVPSAETPSS